MDLAGADLFELSMLAVIAGLVLWLVVSQIIHWQRIRERERMPHWQRRAVMDDDPRRGFDVVPLADDHSAMRSPRR